MGKANGNQKKKKPHGNRIVMVFGGVALLYFLGQIVSVLSGGVETVSASRVTVDDAITATGCFIRNEIIIDGATGDTVEHVVHNGEKVYVGARLAVEYADSGTLDISNQIKLLNEEISLIQSALDSSGNLADTAKLDQLITIQMQALAQQTHEGMVSDLGENTNALRQLVLRRGAGGQDIQALQAELQALQQQKNALQSSVNARTNVIASPCAGFFSDTVDGYESIFQAAEIDSLTVEDFEDKLSQEAQPDYLALGKVMQGFDWYFATVISSNDAEEMKVGNNYRLRFAQVSQDVKASLYAVKPAQTGNKTLLIFESNVIGSELVSMRQQVVDIVRGTYSGIKVPKSAIRTQDGALGVYTLSGMVSRFKKITPLFEGDTYFVIAQGNKENAGVVVQDEIIIRARGLEDKKVVK